MKIIELLNKIVNDEEVPKKIKWQDTEYEYDYSCKNYVGDYEDLFSVIDGTNLSDKIEILEEDKKIEKIDIDSILLGGKEANKEFGKKINEIIDILNNN